MKKSLLLILLLTGCGPKEGHVISRSFTPAYDETIYITENDGDYKNPVFVTIPETFHHDNHWEITVTLDGTNFGTWSCTQWDYDHATNRAWFRKGYGIIPEPTIEQ